MYAVTPELPITVGVGKQAAIQSCVGTELWKNFTRGVFELRQLKEKKRGLRV